MNLSLYNPQIPTKRSVTLKNDKTESPFFVHIHLPKTGGSTFNSILRKNFGDRFEQFAGRFIYLFDNFTVEQVTNFINLHTVIDCVASHKFSAILPYEGASRKVIAIAFVRDPVDTFFSLYFHLRHRGGNFEQAKLNVVEYVDSKIASLKPQQQMSGFLRRLTGQKSELAFQHIRKLVLNKYLYLFDTYKMDQAMQLLHQEFPEIFKSIFFDVKNVSRKDQEVPNELRLRVKDKVSIFDYKLLALADENLHNLMSKYSFVSSTRLTKDDNQKVTKSNLGQTLLPPNSITETKQPASTLNTPVTLHVGRPNVGDRQKLLQRITDILDRKWLTNRGRYVTEFERHVESLLGVKNCIAMCSGTVALEIAIRALGLTGEVIVPSFTFIATAHALQWQEITPVFCDIDPKTHTIDPAKIERLITPRTTGIIGVHLWGRACLIDDLTQIAHRHNLKLLFDAAHAFGVTYRGQMIGQFGDAEVFSFHATKFVNTLEGGAIVTNDDILAEKARLMKNFGFIDYDQVDYIGTNGKMNEISAAMGLTSLESMTEFTQVNFRNYHCYQQYLADTSGIKLLTYPQDEVSNYQYIVLEVDESITGVSRDRLIEILHAENVLARRYFYPGCHRMEPYRSYFPNAGLLLPETERLVERVLVLPTGTTIHLGDVEKICQIIRSALPAQINHAIQRSIVESPFLQSSLTSKL